MTKHQIHFFGILSALLAGLALLCCLGIRGGKETIHGLAKAAFEQTVIDDLENRHLAVESSHYPLGRKVKRVKIASEDGIETIEFEDSMDERIVSQMMRQFVLAELRPIQPDTFNLLFQKTLAKYEVASEQTGVIYQYQGKKQYSHNDSVVATSAILLPPDTLDLKKSVIVQAWVKVAPQSVFKHISLFIWMCIVIYVVCAVGISVYLFKQQELQRLEKDHHKEKEELLGQAVKLGDMILYENNCTVFARGGSHTLGKYQFELLLLFARAPQHTLTVNTITEKFWPGHIAPRNNMYNLIYKTKEAIKPYSNCEITSEGEEIYRLTCGS